MHITLVYASAVSFLFFFLGLIIPIIYVGFDTAYTKEFWGEYGPTLVEFFAMTIPFVSGLLVLQSWWNWKKRGDHE